MADDEVAQTLDPIRKGLPVTLRRLRLERGYTRQEMVERAESLSESHLAKIEQGERFPSRKILPGIARALDMEVPALIAMAEEEGWAILKAEGVSLEVAAEYVSPTAPRSPRSSRNLPAAMLSRSPDHRQEAAARPAPGWLLGLQPILEPMVRGQDSRVAEEVARAASLLTGRSDDLDPSVIVRLLERLIGSGAPPERMSAVLDVCLAYLDAVREAGDDADLDRLLHIAHALVRHDPAAIPKVATAPSDTHHYVWPSALGRDADGRLWIDPLATAHRAGIDTDDPRIHRLDDGRIRVDLSRVEGAEIPPRDPARHRMSAHAVRNLNPAELDLTAYEATTHRIAWADDVTIEVAPAERGTTEGDFPASHRSIHIVTACNPAPHVLPPEENARRNEALFADIKAAGHEWRHAVGLSVDPDQPWEEPSFALLDVDGDTVIDLARRHDQTTIFEWTPEQRTALWCAGGTDPYERPAGWSTRWL